MEYNSVNDEIADDVEVEVDSFTPQVARGRRSIRLILQLASYRLPTTTAYIHNPPQPISDYLGHSNFPQHSHLKPHWPNQNKYSTKPPSLAAPTAATPHTAY
jgi:hypothetical protein